MPPLLLLLLLLTSRPNISVLDMTIMVYTTAQATPFLHATQS
jgi:hypothetical protein